MVNYLWQQQQQQSVYGSSLNTDRQKKKITATSPYFIEVLLDLRITVVVRHGEMFT